MKKYLALFVLVAACSPVVNSTNSILQDRAGEARGHVNVSFSTYNGTDGKMTLVTSDGEIYQGNVIGDKREAANDVFDDNTSYYSKAKAVLLSNRGHSMKCNFDLAEPSLGITSGAIGECRSSNGWFVPITMSGRTKKLA